MNTRFNTLDEWLAWQETLNPAEIELGLDRLQQVMHRGDIADRFACPLILIAGTNGKGSTVAFLEAIAAAAGYKVCSYTSPHLHRYNERIRLAGSEVSDEALCEAFQRIDQARGDVPLTYFEFGTLAAIDLFHRAIAAGECDLVVMEIGLGARLDAVNVMQPDASVITSIGLDHTEWLGDTREKIAVEKAGVMRADKVTVIGDWLVPESLFDVAKQVGAHTLGLGSGLFIAVGEEDWSLQVGEANLFALAPPAMRGEHQYTNAACAIAVILQLADRLPVDQRAIDEGLRNASVAGRMQVRTMDDGTEIVLDVAHNTEAIACLTEWCQQHPVEGDTRVVLAMMRDKPVAEVVGELSGIASAWYLADLPEIERALDAQTLKDLVGGIVGDGKLIVNETVSQACEDAWRSAQGGRVVVTGSFFTVAAAELYFEQQQILAKG